jgi:hypothetical protein
LIRKDGTPNAQIAPEQIKLADDIHLASQGWPQAQWWKQFNDPQLDALIAKNPRRFAYARRSKAARRKSAVAG